jgi:hypothetical protein
MYVNFESRIRNNMRVKLNRYIGYEIEQGNGYV